MSPREESPVDRHVRRVFAWVRGNSHSVTGPHARLAVPRSSRPPFLSTTPGEPMDRHPLYYTFGNHMHWADMQWRGYEVLPGSVRDMLHLVEEARVRGNVDFDGIGYERMAAECPDALAALRAAVGEGSVNLGDGIFILNYLFVNGPAGSCGDARDFNDDGTQNLGISSTWRPTSSCRERRPLRRIRGAEAWCRRSIAGCSTPVRDPSDSPVGDQLHPSGLPPAERDGSGGGGATAIHDPTLEGERLGENHAEGRSVGLPTISHPGSISRVVDPHGDRMGTDSTDLEITVVVRDRGQAGARRRESRDVDTLEGAEIRGQS